MQGTVESLVCRSCWCDFFTSEHFRLLCVCQCAREPGRHCAGASGDKTVQQIRDGIEAGCNWCNLLYNVTYRLGGESDSAGAVHFDLYDFSPSISTPLGKNAFYLGIDLVTKIKTSRWSLRLHAFADNKDPAASIITARRLQPNIFSESAREQIQDWLADCKDHRECPQQSDSPLPTRIIEVAPKDHPERPRLLVSSGEGMRYGAYAVLSYCWGGECQGALTRSNLVQYRELIPLEDLGQTFRDAITVTKAIGVPFLWIDALCIVQNDEEDKLREISKIRQVYRSSLLSIVATSASKSSQGFLAKRREPKTPYLVPFYIQIGQFGSMSVDDLDLVEYDESREPLNQRAWTLQESLLATRHLSFSSHTLQWRCRHHVRNLDDSLHLVNYAEELDYSESLLTLSTTRMDAVRELMRWLVLVNVYSSRGMSSARDKLNAISAIAQDFSSTLGPCYYAGIWSFSLISQLYWVPRSTWKKYVVNSRPVEYRAPSWSWASLDGPLDICYDVREAPTIKIYRCDFISCDVVPKLKDFPFGEVISGSLKLKAVLKQAWLKPAFQTILWLEGDCSLGPIKDNHRLEEESSSISHVRRKMLAYHDEGSDWPPVLVSCLPLICGYDNLTCGLLLVLAGAEPNTFRRIGSFKRVPVSAFEELSQSEFTII